MPFNSHKPNQLDWHQDNRFSLLVDGANFFPAMLDAIEQAEKFILLEFYLVESGHVTRRFINALIRAHRRSVQVYILLDDYGSRNLEQLDREKLLVQGIDLVFYNPFEYRQLLRSLRRDHRKLLLVDGIIAFTGGAGLSDAFQTPFTTHLAWHEVMVRITGPVVVDWMQVFIDTWQATTGHTPTLPACSRQHFTPGQPGRVSLSSGLRLQEIKRSFIKRVRNAEHRVWLTTPYFVPSRKIRRALTRKARAGIDVRLLLPGPLSDHPWVSHAARGFYQRLLRHGVRIFEYQPRFIHAKIGLCDNWCTIGSSNLDRWNQRWNLDANQEVEDNTFSQQVAEIFEEDFQHSHEILFTHWQTRSRRQRFREWLSARLITLLEMLGSRYHK